MRLPFTHSCAGRWFVTITPLDAWCHGWRACCVRHLSDDATLCCADRWQTTKSRLCPTTSLTRLSKSSASSYVRWLPPWGKQTVHPHPTCCIADPCRPNASPQDLRSNMINKIGINVVLGLPAGLSSPGGHFHINADGENAGNVLACPSGQKWWATVTASCGCASVRYLTAVLHQRIAPVCVLDVCAAGTAATSHGSGWCVFLPPAFSNPPPPTRHYYC